MELGDVIVLHGTVRLVARLDGAGHAFAYAADGKGACVQEDLDLTDPHSCKVKCNPYRDWPFIIMPSKPRFGRILLVALPHLNGDLRPLTLFENYLVGEPLRSGGSLHLHPSLGLRYPDRVVVRFERGQVSLIVPRRYHKVSKVVAAAKFGRLKSGRRRLTVYDHLLGDTLGEDENVKA